MKRLVTLALLSAFGMGRAAVAAEVVWMEMYAGLAYQDPMMTCNLPGSFLNTVNLAAEVSDGHFQRAVLKRGSTLLPFREIEFSPAELAGITVVKDARGHTWLRGFPLSGRIAGWILVQIGSQDCGGLQEIASTTPSTLGFLFSTDVSTVPEPFANESNTLSFSGTRRDGQPFQASLRLYQRPYDGP